MKVVITGGAGFIGLKLAKQLIGKGHEVVLIDSLTPQIHGDIPNALAIPDGVSLHRLDVRDIEAKIHLLEGCDWVYHLAAETGTAQSMYQMRHYVSVNEEGTACLLQAIARCKQRPKTITLASSRSVYGEGAYRQTNEDGQWVQPNPRTPEQLSQGEWEHMGEGGRVLRPVPTPETMGFAPGSVYAATKASQELLLTVAAPALGMRAQILRFQNVYGEGQSLQNPYTGIISIFFNRARQGLEIPLYEDGLESRDFVHVDDVVQALFLAPQADLPSGRIINVGSGLATTVEQLAATLLQQSGLQVPVKVTGQYRVGDIRHCFADVRRLKSDLGLTPSVTLEEGMRRFCQWAGTQPVYIDKSAAAAAELQQHGLAGSKREE